MDLLNDYSSSDDEGGGASALKPPPREIKKAKPSPPPKATKQSRVLKLASVLPPEILERLARDDDESSSDEDDQAVKEKQGSETASLLSNLKTIKPKNASLFPVAAFTEPGSAAKATSISKPTKPPSDIKLQTPSLPVPKPSVMGKPRAVQAAPMAYAQRNNSLPSSSPSIAPPSTPSTNSTTPSLNPRKRRQQIERALRNGDVSAVTPTLQAGTIMGDSSAVRVVDYEAAQTIRQVPTGVYDPATGKLSDAGKRGAGKNQVHFLVHQAQALERQRAEQVGSSNGNRRADAKRKYGW